MRLLWWSPTFTCTYYYPLLYYDILNRQVVPAVEISNTHYSRSQLKKLAPRFVILILLA